MKPTKQLYNIIDSVGNPITSHPVDAIMAAWYTASIGNNYLGAIHKIIAAQEIDRLAHNPESIANIVVYLTGQIDPEDAVTIEPLSAKSGAVAPPKKVDLGVKFVYPAAGAPAAACDEKTAIEQVKKAVAAAAGYRFIDCTFVVKQ